MKIFKLKKRAKFKELTEKKERESLDYGGSQAYYFGIVNEKYKKIINANTDVFCISEKAKASKTLVVILKPKRVFVMIKQEPTQNFSKANQNQSNYIKSFKNVEVKG